MNLFNLFEAKKKNKDVDHSNRYSIANLSDDERSEYLKKEVVRKREQVAQRKERLKKLLQPPSEEARIRKEQFQKLGDKARRNKKRRAVLNTRYNKEVLQPLVRQIFYLRPTLKQTASTDDVLALLDSLFKNHGYVDVEILSDNHRTWARKQDILEKALDIILNVGMNKNALNKNILRMQNALKRMLPDFYKTFGDKMMIRETERVFNEKFGDRWNHENLFLGHGHGHGHQLEVKLADEIMASLYARFLEYKSKKDRDTNGNLEESVNEANDTKDYVSNQYVGNTRKSKDAAPELGYAIPDSGRSSAEIAKELEKKSKKDKQQKNVQSRVSGKQEAEQARIKQFSIYTDAQLNKLITYFDSEEYANSEEADDVQIIHNELTYSEEHRDAVKEYKRRMKIKTKAQKEAKEAGFTKKVYGKIIGDVAAHKRAIKAEARAKKEEEKAKKQAERKVKQDAFKKASSGVIDRRSNKPAPDPSKPWNIMKLKGGRKEYRKILNSPSHPRHNEAKEISVKSESMQYDFETFISEWSLNPMDWFDDNDDEKDDLDKIPGDDSGMIKKNVGKVRSRNRKTKRAGDCIIQGKEYDPNTGGCR